MLPLLDRRIVFAVAISEIKYFLIKSFTLFIFKKFVLIFNILILSDLVDKLTSFETLSLSLSLSLEIYFSCFRVNIDFIIVFKI